MDSFSWADTVRATVSTCLPCFSNHNPTSDSEPENEGLSAPRRGSQTHYEELEGLLRDPDETDDGGAETMSLHSNLGIGDRRRRRKKKKKRSQKTIRLFGFHLFGRPPIQLSDSEDDDEGMGNIGSHRRRQRRPGRLAVGYLGSAYSSSSAEAFDSDASPLDTAAISQLSPEGAAARAARAAAEREAEEQRRRKEQLEKEERRRRRRERKEMERQAAAEEFEGFPGSGSLRPPPLSPGSLSSMTSPTMPTGPGSPAPVEEFGPYMSSSIKPEDEDGEGEEADFGGEAYTRKSSSRGRGSDSSRSHTLSQTSASRSNADSSSHYFPYPQYQHQAFTSQSSPLASPLPYTTSFASQVGAVGSAAQAQAQGHSQIQAPRAKKTKSKRSSNSATTASSRSPTSQSASLPSLDSDSPRDITEPFIVQHDDDEGLAPTPRHANPAETSLFPKDGNESKFPAIGLGGARRTNSSSGTAISGVFLARRGDD